MVLGMFQAVPTSASWIMRKWRIGSALPAILVDPVVGGHSHVLQQGVVIESE